MRIKLSLLTSIIFLSSCSYINGPEGLFPPTQYDFLSETVEKDIILPANLDLVTDENHYPVLEIEEVMKDQNVPKPRQIFASSGNSSVQLRRLGELMWIYIETLPSTSWPISKNYWDTSVYEVTSTNPNTGEIIINFDEDSTLNMKIEHGIKEASTEIFLNQVSKENNEIQSNLPLIQSELENIVNYFAESVDSFTGTSLAAQNLNEMKKAKIFAEDGQTVIELNLNFDRAWSSVSKAMNASNIVSNDLDRSMGIFYVSYSSEEEDGIFSFLGFGSSKNDSNKNTFNEDSQFIVTITEENNKTYVRAVSKNGKIEDAEELLSKINESLS
jgi:outer membrane protein assembly factor BamC